MIADIQFIHCVEEYEGAEWGLWACEASMVDGSIVTGTIIGDGISNWDEESFRPYEDQDPFATL